MSKVRALRQAQKLNQVDLAARAGVVQSVISRMEKGLSVSPDSAAKVADALGVGVADLELGSESTSRAPSSTPDAAVIPVLRNRPGAEEAFARARADDPTIDDETWETLERSPGLLAFDVPLTPALLIDLARVVRRHRPPKK